MENNKYFLPVSVIAAGLLIAGAVFWNGSRPSGPTAPDVDIGKITLDGNPFVGLADAPVTIAFWSDFQCPFCKAFETGGVEGISTPAAFPLILDTYVKTGKVKVVFMDLVFLGNDSVDAARYGRSVWKLYPDQYFEWREAMYKAQDDEGDKGFGDAASIDTLNKTITGIDAVKVAADVVANKAAYDAMIARDRAEAVKIGVESTPSFVLGKQLITGAYPFDNFKSAIDALL